ncbi:MAG: cytochrome C oxidase subunit II [Treponema sp.]|nr:MAG: cytochrome C oxidase subunit II [Treponema sp.]
MASLDLPQSPNVFHPEKPSAVGSRNSLAQDYRDQQKEVNQLIEEETNKVLHHLGTKLPKEVLERLDVMGGVKEKLYNYFNQNYQNMFNRYMVTTEDEMVKKVRGFVDREEMKVLDRYTPKEIATLLDAVGGADKFNTGEIEKSIVNMYGHLQGHVQRGVNDLETMTNSLLRQKTDVGGFVRGENAYSIVKCAFRDSLYKPKTVTDVKLSINILDTELISPIFHYQSTVEYLIKDLLGDHYINMIDKEIEKLKDERIDQGLEELDGSGVLFEKINRVEDITDDDVENPKSKRYDVISKKLMERINNLRAEIDPETYDQLNIRENIKKIVDIENIRNRGFNTAINSLTSILDTSKMGYQYIENFKNTRELIVREYEDTVEAQLPDEHFQIKLKYMDNAQLLEERKAYEVMMRSFETEIEHVWDVVNATYEKSKYGTRINDFNDLAKKYKNHLRKEKEKDGLPVYEDIAKVWDEVAFIKTGETEVEKMNRTYTYEKDKLRKKLIIMREKLQDMYDYKYPIERRVIETRLDKLSKDYNSFDYLINPYHIQPGVLLDIDITSIKRKKGTLEGMANVLNEFLHGISKGFEDAAFASFSRRRSTVRADLAKTFGSDEEEAPVAGQASGSANFIDMVNDTPAIEAKVAESVSTPAKKTRGRKPRTRKTGAVDKKGGRRGRSKSSLKEI